MTGGIYTSSVLLFGRVVWAWDSAFSDCSILALSGEKTGAFGVFRKGFFDISGAIGDMAGLDGVGMKGVRGMIPT